MQQAWVATNTAVSSTTAAAVVPDTRYDNVLDYFSTVATALAK